MTDRNLTQVELAFYPEHKNYWLRFGTPTERLVLDRRRSVALFEPGQVLGYVRWTANEFGTQSWRLTILETKEPSRLLSRVRGVTPGAEVLLLVTGALHTKRALGVLDELETRGFSLADVSPAYYRHVHVRLSAGRPARLYTADQHAAHMAAKRVRP
jgi:hypothetical protein